MKKIWEKIIVTVLSWFDNKKQMEYEERNIAREIGIFILQENIKKYPDDSHEFVFAETCKAIRLLGITSVSIKKGEVVITLSRPGLLIGKRGLRIQALQETLKRKVVVKEELVTDCLIPYWYVDEFEDDVRAEL